MNVTKVELPDRLLTIEGGDARGIAGLLINHYLPQSSAAAPAPSTQEALEMPVMTFEHRTLDKLHPRVTVNVPVVGNVGNVEPLPLPRMEF